MMTDNNWISAKERLPKSHEYIGNVRKYYLVQDEYGDMHIAHYRGEWFSIEKTRYPLENDIVAWRELPERYEGCRH